MSQEQPSQTTEPRFGYRAPPRHWSTFAMFLVFAFVIFVVFPYLWIFEMFFGGFDDEARRIRKGVPQ